MKQAILSFATATFLSAVSSANAASMYYEVTPGSGEAAGFTFDITTDKLPDGTVKFRVLISEKKSKFVSFSTSLSVVNIKYGGWGDPRGWSSRRVRRLAFERQANSIVCAFSVEKASMDDPHLCFVFGHMPARMPSMDVVYARLDIFAGRRSDAFDKQRRVGERELEREKAILAAYRNRYPDRPEGPNFQPTHRVYVYLKENTPVASFFTAIDEQLFIQQWCLMPKDDRKTKLALDVGFSGDKAGLVKSLQTFVDRAWAPGRGYKDLQDVLGECQWRNTAKDAPFWLLIGHITEGRSRRYVEELFGKPSAIVNEGQECDYSIGPAHTTVRVHVVYSDDKVTGCTSYVQPRGGLQGSDDAEEEWPRLTIDSSGR